MNKQRLNARTEAWRPGLRPGLLQPIVARLRSTTEQALPLKTFILFLTLALSFSVWTVAAEGPEGEVGCL